MAEVHEISRKALKELAAVNLEVSREVDLDACSEWLVVEGEVSYGGEFGSFSQVYVYAERDSYERIAAYADRLNSEQLELGAEYGIGIEYEVWHIVDVVYPTEYLVAAFQTEDGFPVSFGRFHYRRRMTAERAARVLAQSEDVAYAVLYVRSSPFECWRQCMAFFPKS